MLQLLSFRLMRTLSAMSMLLLCCFALPTLARAQTDQAVYTDALLNGWQNWSWATVNLANTAPVQSGSDSISVSAGPYQALYLHQTPFDSSTYGDLVFWINGGATGGQLLQVQATLNGAAQTVVTLPALAANTWQQISIPLSSLGVQNQPDMDGFWIQDRSGTTQPTFFVDTISITALPPPSVVNVTVNAADAVRVVDARHFGVNTAVWDSLLDTSITTNLLTAMGAGSLRFPGGSLSDDYHWATNTTDSNTWTWSTSFDQFAQVATAVGAQVFVTVDYGSGTPAEAAAWVQESNVTNHYGFKYWEIGNECYGSWETDTNSVPHDPYTYAQRFQQYYTQMKAIDPTIKIGAVAVPGEDSYANNTNHPVVNPVTGVTHNGWTPVMLATLNSLGVTPDFLIYHRYPQNPGGESDEGLLLSNGTWSSDAADLRQQLNDYLGAAGFGVELDNTENNSVSSGPGKQTTSLVNGLFLADSICAAMNTEFNAVTWWDLRNGQETGNNNSSSLYGWRQYGDYGVVDSANPPGPADTYPTYYVERLLQHFARGGDHLVSAASDYPFLSVCAAQRTAGGLTLLVVNNSASDALNANISISGASPGSTGTLYSYGIPQDNAAETGTGSADIATTPVTGLSTNFAFNFPAYSANVIAFGAASSASPTPTATRTATATATASATSTPTATATASKTATATATASRTATATATTTATPTATLTSTATATRTSTATATATSTATATGSRTPTPTATSTATATATSTATATATNTATATATRTSTATATPTSSATASGTRTPTPTATSTATATATRTATATASNTATATSTPTATATPAAIATVQPASLSWGKHAVGTKSAAKTVSLLNEGIGALSVSSISITAGFLETNTCTSPVLNLKHCTISVKFKPTAVGAITGTLTINDNAANSPQVVQLSGKGTN
jgi:alpha-L-arabinofuranosidase